MKAVLYSIIFCFLAEVAISAALFRNLDFEDAVLNLTVPPAPDGSDEGAGPLHDLLPGWSVYGGITFRPGYDNPESDLLSYNERSTGGFRQTFVTLSRNESGFAFLVAPADPFSSELSIWLAQRGDVPADTRSLLADGGGFHLWVEGVQGPQTGSMFDLSRYAGQNVEIAFEFYPQDSLPFGFPVYSGVDNIRFSPQSIPELPDGALTITMTPSAENAPRVTLSFTVVSGHDYFVEARDNLKPESSWQPLRGAPHNSGSVVDFAANPQRFYRVRVVASALFSYNGDCCGEGAVDR